jgi:transposase-like protein
VAATSNGAVRKKASEKPLGSTPMRKRTFSREFKLQVVRQLTSGEKRVSQLCREHNLCQTLVRHWREQYEAHGELSWPEPGMGPHIERDAEARVGALEAALGRAHLENEFLRHAIKQFEKRGSLPGRNGK